MRPPDLNTPALRAAGPRAGSLTERTVATASQVLAGESRGWRTVLAFGGPAIIASIAYMDPGNFATNIQAGAKYGYGLLWVVLVANVIAMLFQGLSAKLGIVTGKNLAEMCRDHFPRPVVFGDVGGQRDRRDGDRSRRISRRRHWPVAVVPHAAARRHGGHRDRHLCAAELRAIRLPPARTHHRRHRRHDLPLLCRRNVHRAGGLGERGLSSRGAADRR